MPGIDGDKLKKALLGVLEAFEAVRELTEGFVRNRILRFRDWSPTELDEIVEKVYQQIGRAAPSFDPERSKNPFSWFMTVVDHYVAEYCRKHSIVIDSLDRPELSAEEADEEVPELPDNTSLTPSQRYALKSAREILVEAMSRISSPRRLAMILFVTFYPELTYEQIAKVMGLVSADAAKQLKYNTMREMRGILLGMGYRWEMFGEAFREEQ